MHPQSSELSHMFVFYHSLFTLRHGRFVHSSIVDNQENRYSLRTKALLLPVHRIIWGWYCTVFRECLWPLIFLTQIRYPFTIAKLHKELPLVSTFFQSCHYFAWFFQKNKILLENTQKKSRFYTLKKLKKVATALDKNWYRA